MNFIKLFALALMILSFTSCGDEESNNATSNASTLSFIGSLSFQESPFGKNSKLSMEKKQQNNKDYDVKQKLNIGFFTKEIDTLGKNRIQQIRNLIELFIIDGKYKRAASIKEIQQMIREKKFTIRELAIFYLSQIKDFEKNNAIITINEHILEEAQKQDEALQKNEKMGKLFGVFVIAKDNIATKDMKTTAGSYALNYLQFTQDATIIKNIKKQSGLILAKANMSELSGYSSFNAPTGFSSLGGHTHSQSGHDVGGSSAGSAVAVDLNLCTVAIGAETSGSLIYPAGQNNVYALKPTKGLVSGDLIIPLIAKNDTAGPMARNAEDLILLQSALANKEVTLQNVSNIKIGFIKNYVFDDNSKIYSKVLDALIKRGASITSFDYTPPAGRIDYLIFMAYFSSKDIGDFFKEIKNVSNIKYDSLNDVLDVFKKHEKDFYYGHNALDFAKKASVEIPDAQMQAQYAKNRANLKENLNKYFAKYNVDVFVSSSNLMSAQYAYAGFPAINIPVGMRENGEPFGMTIIGKENSDDLLLSLALAISNIYKK